MRDVRIMKKIQIYNNLQVLCSGKVKFVSLSQVLGCPLFGSNSSLFTVPGFIVSLLGVKKNEEEGKKRYKGKKRRNKTGKKERDEDGVKRKKK